MKKVSSYKKKKQLRSQCDKLWYEAYLKPECEVCGESATQVHHFYPKGLYGHLRYNRDNGISLCVKCHFFHHHRGDPLIHQAIIRARGKRWFNRLQKLARNRPKNFQTTLLYYKKIKEDLTKL